MIFLIMGTTKIGDLDHVYPKEEYKKDWKDILNGIISKKHTISLA